VLIAHTPGSGSGPSLGSVLFAVGAGSLVGGLLALMEASLISVPLLVAGIALLVGAWARLSSDVISADPKLVAAVRGVCRNSPNARSRGTNYYVVTGPEAHLVLEAGLAVSSRNAVAQVRRQQAKERSREH